MHTNLRRRLLAWFCKNARPLPWRADRDPYRIWISEVMLQQTQVAAVIPYFERFLQQFPNLQALAEADEQVVLRAWEGLGYYRRARDLSRAAKLLIDAGHATVPDDLELVYTLPGFGRYTANAVLSQAYDRRLPILEANSQRVLCRLFGIDRDPRDAAVKKQLWQFAEELLPSKAAGDFNQAIMELGALVCTPTKPSCPRCPLRAHCQAKQMDRQEEIPSRARSAVVVAVEEVAVVIRKRDKLLLVQRPEEGRWARMWEFPHHPLHWMESHADAAQRLLAELGITGEVRAEIAAIRHNVTRFNIHMVCLQVEYRKGTLRRNAYPNSAWTKLDDLHAYPLSTPQRKLAKHIAQLTRRGGAAQE
jgi:A/G-specific adenine glycosylase